MSGPKSGRHLTSAIRRIVRLYALDGSAARLILAFMIILTVLILTAPTRTVQLQARTLSAEVELIGEPLAWDLTGAVICKPTLDFDSDPLPPCGVGQEFAGALDGPVAWPRKQKLAIDWNVAVLRIRLLTRNNEWPAGTVLRLSQKDAARNGALALSGYLTLGQEMSAGATGYVLEGRYAIYEQGLISGWLNWSPDVTREGDLNRGDQLQIVCQDSLFHDCAGGPIVGRADQYRNTVTASLSVDHDGKAGFHVVATGAEANSLLEVAYAGRDRILLIRPSWVQRAAASSSLLALSLLFSLMAPLLLPLLGRK